MSFKLSKVLLLLMAFTMLSLVVTAQEEPIPEENFEQVQTIDTVDPAPEVVAENATNEIISDITENSEAFYGVMVTIEGRVNNYIGARVFEMGDDDLLSRNMVLVANNSSEPLPANLFEGAYVRLTGRVHPSYDVVSSGMDWSYELFDPEIETTSELERFNMVDLIQRGYVPNDFGSHTIIEL
ncbi:MAG: hypothetical protein KC496_02180, partial [Anaerolineae bacterium]|nr:hypothetical protein [Anaerolineae bacterium]